MSAKTKIVVVKAKELIYTALFVCLGIILILLLIFMFAPEEKSTKTSAGVYTPGVYTSTIAADQKAAEDYLEVLRTYALEPADNRPGHEKLKMVDFEMTDSEGHRQIVSIPKLSLLPPAFTSDLT